MGRFVIVFVGLCSFYGYTIASECALFKANTYDTFETMDSTYIQLPGVYSVVEGEYFEVSFDVFPSAWFSNGAMFSLGKPSNFSYYTYTEKYSEKQPQYISLQFEHKSLGLMLKTNIAHFYHELSVSKAWPEPYDIMDGNWHYVHAYSEPGQRKWAVAIDDIAPVSEDIIPELTNITFYHSLAYIGGRPGYIDQQFRGIIRNVYLNGHWVSLADGYTNGRVEIVDCDSDETDLFIDELLDEIDVYEQLLG